MVGALGFVYRCYCCGGEYHDGYVLGDGGFAVVGNEACCIGVAEGVICAGVLGEGELSGFSVVAVMEIGGREDVRLLVMIVRESRGTLSFFVRRMDAEDALRAERRARRRGASGMRRFMVLFSTADWIV